MKYNIVAPLGGSLAPLYVGVREFPTEKIFLIHQKHDLGKVEESRRELEKFRIAVQPVELKGELLEGMFRAFGQVKQAVGEESILVNVSTGDQMTSCAALAASFVNGLRAFHVMDDKVAMFPVLKFSYYRLLPEKKLGMIKFLNGQPDCCASLEDLSKRIGMSLALISYHVNGSAKVEGLVSQGLVEVHVGPGGRTKVMLTPLGKLIAEGFIESPQDPIKTG
jgi:hypothetical protein